jgi:hypothetical protein
MADIRICRDDDIETVMAFINLHWRKGHVLATSQKLMDWQYKQAGGLYNFVLACEGDDLLAILGFIPVDRYDPALRERAAVWLALWKLRSDVKIAGLGLRMLRFLERTHRTKTIAVNGINAAHPPMYQALGYRTGVLHHYYLFNPNSRSKLLAIVDPAVAVSLPQAGHAVMQEMDQQTLQQLHWLPENQNKSPVCFAERYLRHPFYRYQVHLFSHGNLQALLATRVARHGNAAALRIVDFMGDVDMLAQVGGCLADLMQQQGVEYVDFLNSGIPSGLLEQAGFAELDFDGPIIIPNRFEPLERKNHRIFFAIKTSDTSEPLIFRADGDQDRPNLLQDEND